MIETVEAAVWFENLGHAYRPGDYVFRGYSARVPCGSVVAILGPNGCGKTTLLRILLGLLTPSEGDFGLTGRLAFVPQLFQAGFDYTAQEMVVMGRARGIGLFSQPSRKDEDAALEALARLGVSELAEHAFNSLSGGQRQLVMLARALVSDPRVLLLDEPTSALDLKNQSMVLGWIDRLSHSGQMTIVFTTHHPHHALAVADLALLMGGGDAYRFGPSEAELSESALSGLYGVPIRRTNIVHEGNARKALVQILPARL